MRRGIKYTLDENMKLVELADYRAGNASAYVIDDEIPGGLKSMADKKMYTSKRELRKSYQRLGYVEVGDETNEKYWRKDPDPKYAQRLTDDIGKSYYDVRDGNAPLTELDKERCKIINRQIRDSYDNREYDEYGKRRS